MAASFKIGDKVKLNALIPQGPVKALAVNQDGDIQYLIDWTDSDGEAQSRWFKEDELEKV